MCIFSHHHLHLILVFGLSVRVFDLLWENHVKLEQKHPSLSTLSDELLWIPDMEGVLENDVTQVVNTDITAVKHREMKCVVCLEHWGHDWFPENPIDHTVLIYLSWYRKTHVKTLFNFSDLFIRRTRQKVLEKKLIFGHPIKQRNYLHICWERERGGNLVVQTFGLVWWDRPPKVDPLLLPFVSFQTMDSHGRLEVA